MTRTVKGISAFKSAFTTAKPWAPVPPMTRIRLEAMLKCEIVLDYELVDQGNTTVTWYKKPGPVWMMLVVRALNIRRFL